VGTTKDCITSAAVAPPLPADAGGACSKTPQSLSYCKSSNSAVRDTAELRGLGGLSGREFRGPGYDAGERHGRRKVGLQVNAALVYGEPVGILIYCDSYCYCRGAADCCYCMEVGREGVTRRR
jgi:hypothetical protein